MRFAVHSDFLRDRGLVEQVHDSKCVTMKLLFMIVFLLLLTMEISSFAIQYYVSATLGVDAGPGTLARPWKTIGHARMVVRASTEVVDYFINIMKGDYHETIEFTTKDSGKGGHMITYRAYGSGTPLITGGLTVTKWESISRDGIFRSFVGKGTKSRQIYVDGIRKPRSSFKGNLTGCTVTLTGYKCAVAVSAHMSSFKNQQYIEVVSQHMWRQPRCLVDSIESDGSINLTKECWIDAEPFMSRVPTAIENALELLTDAGEWYLDVDAGYLYYKPERPLSSSTVILAVQEKLFYGDGSVTAAIENLVFKGLTFSYGTWHIGREGFAENQANVCKDGHSPIGNVMFSYAHNVHFDGCTFIHLGGMGLLMGSGCQDCSVTSCFFRDTSSNGFKLGDMHQDESDKRSYTARNWIFNNSISYIAQEFQAGVGLMLGYTRESKVEHNLVEHTPYTGISNGWGWYKVCSNFAGWNEFRNNLVRDTMNVLFDGGSFYTLGQQNGSLFTGNVLLNSHNFYGSLYLDDGSRFWTVHDNIVFGSSETALIKGASHHIYNNYWQDRGEIVGPFPPAKLPDIMFEGKELCCPDIAGTTRPCGKLDMHDNHIIKSVSEAPSSILRNAGLVLG